MKFKSAKQKREYEENQKSWNSILEKYKPKKLKQTKQDLGSVYKLSNPPGREKISLPSKVSPGGDTTLKKSSVYTGDKMKGIGTLHKSNAVPVFTSDEAKDIASMRR